jgi:hypothetical protein
MVSYSFLTQFISTTYHPLIQMEFIMFLITIRIHQNYTHLLFYNQIFTLIIVFIILNHSFNVLIIFITLITFIIILINLH